VNVRKLLRSTIWVAAFAMLIPAAAKADGWPQEGVNTLRKICYQQPRRDVPPQYLNAYCGCYVNLVPSNIAWNDWLLLDEAVRVKGRQNLDAQEKAIIISVLDDATYCFLKYVPQHDAQGNVAPQKQYPDDWVVPK
jgi:hypothetical protein